LPCGGEGTWQVRKIVMDIDGFLELLKKRRNIRKFRPDPIPEKALEKILEAARWAMSGANAQPWEFIVVKNQQTKDEIARAIFEQRKIEYSVEQTRVEDLRHNGFLHPPDVPDFSEAPVLIVVCGDKRTLMATVLSHNFIGGEGAAGAPYLKNMANATHNMQLAAAVLGLGSGWISVGSSSETSIKAILDVPDALDVHTIVPIGYPAYQPGQGYRRELQEMVHFDRYEKNKCRSMDEVLDYLRSLRKRTRPAYRKGDPPEGEK
jgi:5,6-dimethylbenzimidazole synthase